MSGVRASPPGNPRITLYFLTKAELPGDSQARADQSIRSPRGVSDVQTERVSADEKHLPLPIQMDISGVIVEVPPQRLSFTMRR